MPPYCPQKVSRNLHPALSRQSAVFFLRALDLLPFADTGIATSKSEACVKLNLAASTCGAEDSADVFGEIAGCILESGVSASSQRERTLRVTRNRKIRMIEEIVGFHSNCDFLAFRQLEARLQCQIKLREPGSAQDISPSITKLTGGRWRKWLLRFV